MGVKQSCHLTELEYSRLNQTRNNLIYTRNAYWLNWNYNWLFIWSPCGAAVVAHLWPSFQTKCLVGYNSTPIAWWHQIRSVFDDVCQPVDADFAFKNSSSTPETTICILTPLCGNGRSACCQYWLLYNYVYDSMFCKHYTRSTSSTTTLVLFLWYMFIYAYMVTHGLAIVLNISSQDYSHIGLLP